MESGWLGVAPGAADAIPGRRLQGGPWFAALSGRCRCLAATIPERWRNGVLALLLVVLMALGIGALRAAGALQGLELHGHDLMQRWAGSGLAPARALPLTLVWLTDEDEAALGSPLPDQSLAEVLRRLQQADPAAIGLDLYRDAPIPARDGSSGRHALDEALRGNSALYATFKFGGVPPPAALADSGRVGFADFLHDDGGFLRRGLLFLDDGQQIAASLAFRLASHVLAAEGITPRAGVADAQHLRLGQAEFAPLEPPFGPYRDFDGRGYQFLLAFPLPQEAIHEITVGQLLAEGLPAGSLAGRVVLVGSRTEAGKDYFFTPYSRWQPGDQRVFGALAHALAVRQLVAQARGDLPVPWQWLLWQEVLWLLVWCGLGAGMGGLARSPGQFGLLLVASTGALVVMALVAQRAGLLLPWVPALLGCFLTLLVVALEHLRQARLARAQWAALFARRTSPALAEHCWRHRAELLEDGRMRPQILHVTVLFTDLRGFSARAEQMPAEALMGWLNAYMEAMVGEVFRHGGFVDKLIGDAVMAVFGVPLAAMDPAACAANAQAAVDCACAMAARLDAFNREWQQWGHAPASMRIGIASGPVVAGTLGSSARHQEYTVLGDTVNTAARLESHDKRYGEEDPCRILVDEATAGLLATTRADMEPVGEWVLQGKAEGVRVYRVCPARAGTP